MSRPARARLVCIVLGRSPPDYLNDRFAEDWCLEPGRIPEPSYRRLDGSQATAGPHQRGEEISRRNSSSGRPYSTSGSELPPAADGKSRTPCGSSTFLQPLIGCAPGQYVDERRRSPARGAWRWRQIHRTFFAACWASGRSVVAGRLAGAFRNIGRNEDRGSDPASNASCRSPGTRV